MSEPTLSPAAQALKLAWHEKRDAHKDIVAQRALLPDNTSQLGSVDRLVDEAREAATQAQAAFFAQLAQDKAGA